MIKRDVRTFVFLIILIITLINILSLQSIIAESDSNNDSQNPDEIINPISNDSLIDSPIHIINTTNNLNASVNNNSPSVVDNNETLNGLNESLDQKNDTENFYNDSLIDPTLPYIINETINPVNNETIVTEYDPVINKTVKIVKAPWSVRCRNNEIKISEKILKYNKDKEKYLKQFSKLVLALDKIIKKADKKKLNSTNLNNDKIILNYMINTFSEDYDDLLIKLEKSRENLCDKKEKQFNKDFKEVKSQLKIVKNDIDSIKKYYKTSVKANTLRLKEEERLLKEMKKVKSSGVKK